MDTFKQTKTREIIDYIMQQLPLYPENFIFQFDDDGYLDCKQIFQEIFNTGNIITTDNEAREWIDNDIDVLLHCIDTVKEYENETFGFMATNVGSVLKIVNMYVYILGEEILPTALEKLYHEKCEKMLDIKLANNEPHLIDKIMKYVRAR
jgi:hypothetical protein